MDALRERTAKGDFAAPAHQETHRSDAHVAQETRQPYSFFSEPGQQPLEEGLLDTELRFYHDRSWCLNAFPTIREVVQHLLEELARMDHPQEDWQHVEIMTNVFLLSCALADTVDDHLVGEQFDFSRVTAVAPALGLVVRAAEALLMGAGRFRAWQLSRVHTWREAWRAAVVEFLKRFVADGDPDRDALSRAKAELTRLLGFGFPAEVLRLRPRIPAAFRSQDLTHFDILALGRRFTAAFPEHERPVLVVGPRTAGSYFAPLLCAWLAVQGYRHLEYVTFRPKVGVARWERTVLERNARKGARAVIVDEPSGTGRTLAKSVDSVLKAGFPAGEVTVLFPIHPTRRGVWARGERFLSLSAIRILPLEPEQYHKRQLLEPEVVAARLAEYFGRRGYSNVRVAVGPAEKRLGGKFHGRLKRIYRVQLGRDGLEPETRYILAKSVGWGWLAYHAFIAGERLSAFVPPVLGLRGGILYTEWLHQSDPPTNGQDRTRWLEATASYIAARVRYLPLTGNPSLDVGSAHQYSGIELLAHTLARAYGRAGGTALMRPRLEHELARQVCPFPTLIDGRMRPGEWIAGSRWLLKTDFEHHGQGKHELNVTDPAYDLAEAILFLGLSEAEEDWLINRYIGDSGDCGVKQRLFFNKLLAGTVAKATAMMYLADGQRSSRAQEFNRLYIDAWNFLVTHTVRICGRISGRPAMLGWRSPLVVMDIDGVLDTQIFGFPSASAAGLRALSLLHAHDLAVAVNTARPLPQVKEYSRAYGFVGGVADYGAVAWNAVDGREHILVSSEALHQLEKVRNALRQVPGVFLNEDYRYSIRAYTFDCDGGRTVSLPTLFVQHLMAKLKVDRLDFHQTHLDTAIVAREVDKGRGLLALLELVGKSSLETIAIGDSVPDLAMFRVAHRSFAPSHVSCESVAKSLGCRIADRPFQEGLLRSVRSILHPGGGECERCRSAARSQPGEAGPLFWQLLEAADRGRLRVLLHAMLDPVAVRAFARH